MSSMSLKRASSLLCFPGTTVRLARSHSDIDAHEFVSEVWTNGEKPGRYVAASFVLMRITDRLEVAACSSFGDILQAILDTEQGSAPSYKELRHRLSLPSS